MCTVIQICQIIVDKSQSVCVNANSPRKAVSLIAIWSLFIKMTAVQWLQTLSYCSQHSAGRQNIAYCKYILQCFLFHHFGCLITSFSCYSRDFREWWGHDTNGFKLSALFFGLAGTLLGVFPKGTYCSSVTFNSFFIKRLNYRFKQKTVSHCVVCGMFSSTVSRPGLSNWHWN